MTGTPSSASWENSHAIPFLHMLQNTLFRKHWWGFTQNSEAVHQDVPITSSGLRHWPVSSVTANKWVKSWFSSPRGPEVSLRASHLRTSLPPTFQETKRCSSELHGELEKAVIMTFPSGKWSWIKSSAFSSFFKKRFGYYLYFIFLGM